MKYRDIQSKLLRNDQAKADSSRSFRHSGLSTVPFFFQRFLFHAGYSPTSQGSVASLNHLDSAGHTPTFDVNASKVTPGQFSPANQPESPLK
ncbi:MAG: hypothetical protein CMI02_12840 [Oceanospirillaceae bacterium]|nr:hypothetical protein [Oceanospirillaceae bacterium]